MSGVMPPADAHAPVMPAEIMDLLAVRAGGVYLDGTLGDGGHAAALLARLDGACTVIGIDRDPEALTRAAARLAPWNGSCRLMRGNFAEMPELARQAGFDRVDGVILDLGVSSRQLDVPERGFSFRHAGPLDMRMDQTGGMTAADLIAGADERELRDWLWTLGGEKAASRVARAIIRARERQALRTTADLAAVVERVCGGRRGYGGRIHPATRTFQALRIVVNAELESLARGLEAALNLLRPGGRLAALSYHSLEDGLVKRTARAHMPREESLAAGGSRTVGQPPFVRAVNRKPLTPGALELQSNPRARSARLRVLEVR